MRVFCLFKKMYYICKKQNIMYVIIKSIKNKKTGKWLPVILLNSDNEVWEFESLETAEKMKDILQNNSDSGHIYQVKKV